MAHDYPVVIPAAEQVSLKVNRIVKRAVDPVRAARVFRGRWVRLGLFESLPAATAGLSDVGSTPKTVVMR